MKTNQSAAVARLKTLYEKRGENQIFARMLIPQPAARWKRLEEQAAQVASAEFPTLQDTFPVWEDYLAFFDEVEDDRVPSIYPWQYDQGIYGALFGSPIHVNRGGPPGCASSASSPLEGRTYAELLRLAAKPDETWIRRLESDLGAVAALANGRWGVAVPITIDGLNLAMQIRGNQTMLDIYDSPRELKQFLQMGVDLNIKLVERERAAISQTIEGGVCDYFNGGWMLRQGIPMSVDCYNFCNPDVYAEFGLPYQQQLIDHFGGGNFHIHGNGRQLLPQLAKLKGCVVASIFDDGSDIKAMDDLEAIKRQAGSVTPVVSCPIARFVKQLKEKSLVGGVYYNVGPAASVAEANRLMDAVRSYRV